MLPWVLHTVKWNGDHSEWALCLRISRSTQCFTTKTVNVDIEIWREQDKKAFFHCKNLWTYKAEIKKSQCIIFHLKGQAELHNFLSIFSSPVIQSVFAKQEDKMSPERDKLTNYSLLPYICVHHIHKFYQPQKEEFALTLLLMEAMGLEFAEWPKSRAEWTREKWLCHIA